MPMIQIPEGSLLSAIGAGVGAAFLWMLRLERRPRGMTREEHDKICNRRDELISKSFDEVKSILKEQDERAREHRHMVNGELTTIKLSVATLSARAHVDER